MPKDKKNQAGSNSNFNNNIGQELYDASEQGDITKVKELLVKGADVNYTDVVWYFS